MEFDDLMAEVEAELLRAAKAKEEKEGKREPPSFGAWCWGNPAIILAAGCVSAGLVLLLR